MWEPLMNGKFGERYAKQVNMAWMWARIKARTTRLGTFEGGFQAFANRFADHLRSLGVEIRLSTLVKRITPAKQGGIVVQTSEGEVYYDQCLATTSLVPQLAPTAAYLQGLGTKSGGCRDGGR
jgi:phytoene dehydrogenase-like protein